MIFEKIPFINLNAFYQPFIKVKSGDIIKGLPDYNTQLYINVKDFGAKGDNINDDTTFIQNVIDKVK